LNKHRLFLITFTLCGILFGIAAGRIIDHHEILILSRYQPIEILGLHILGVAVVLNLLAQFCSYRRWRGGIWHKTYQRRGGRIWSRRRPLSWTDDSDDASENWPIINVGGARRAAHILGDALCLTAIVEMTSFCLFHITMSLTTRPINPEFYSSSAAALRSGAALAAAGFVLGIVLIQLSRSVQHELEILELPTPIN
jgi:hypothetical protein